MLLFVDNVHKTINLYLIDTAVFKDQAMTHSCCLMLLIFSPPAQLALVVKISILQLLTDRQ